MNHWLFKKIDSNNSSLFAVSIKFLSIIPFVIGIIYFVHWIKWGLGFDGPHARQWLDPYLIIGLPIILFSIGLFKLIRFNVIILAGIISMIFSFQISIGFVSYFMAAVYVFELLLVYNLIKLSFNKSNKNAQQVDAPEPASPAR